MTSMSWMQGMPGSTMAEKVLTKFSDAVVYKDWMLAWTVKDVLADEVLPLRQAWTSLQLRSPPTMDTVRFPQHIIKNQGISCSILLAVNMLSLPAAGQQSEAIGLQA